MTTPTPTTRVKEERMVCCMSCGKTSQQFVLLKETGIPAPKANCPKCNNVAFTIGLTGIGAFMSEVAKQIAQINLDMIDLQSVGEEER